MTAAADPAAEPPRQIGVAVVLHNRRVLVGIRGPDGPLPGLAEFPGGKCEAGESAEQCAIRECREETGLSVATETELRNLRWTYPHGSVHLHFWVCRPRREEDVQTFHQGFRWVDPDELAHLDFPAANQPVIGLVQRLLR